MTKAKGTATNRAGGKTKPDEKALSEMIEKKAYEIYEKRGGKHGKDLDDWLEAEKVVMQKKRTGKEASPS
jgi:Protein of unknown function (DUF2934)